MWWADVLGDVGSVGARMLGLRARHARIVLVAALVVPVVAACSDGSGFRPLHGSIGASVPASEKMQKVAIATIPGRVGLQVRNELMFGTTGGVEPANTEYRLEIAIRERLASTLVEVDGEARARVYNLDASFRLIDARTNAVVLQGTSYGRAGLETFKSIFSNVRARRDAEDRAARTVASDIKTRVATYLATSA
ncbi:MAG: LPS assembly lipoprotein LptE [Hyphomicrobiaceae bacterium]|nr:LPS assembly lipoprotein LptE [Hyphomicrobiaceae bacterium]